MALHTTATAPRAPVCAATVLPTTSLGGPAPHQQEESSPGQVSSQLHILSVCTQT